MIDATLHTRFFVCQHQTLEIFFLATRPHNYSFPLCHCHFLLFFYRTKKSQTIQPPYRGIVIYPRQPANFKVRLRPGYFPSIYFCAVRFRLSEAETPCTTLPFSSITFQIFFSTIRGRESRKPFTEVDF